MVKEKIKEDFTEILYEEIVQAKTYKVIIHDNPETSVDFVLFVLITCFDFTNISDAVKVIMTVEETGKSVVKSGYSHEEANNIVNIAKKLCEETGFKLEFTIEEE